MLTPISERGTASPIRINSPRRIPLSKRSYGTPSYIQRPININTESIDVSRDRYRPKPAEPSPSASLPRLQNDKPLNINDKEKNENSPFMPRIDGKPETGIDSSPGIQRNTIKRGRTVVRLHTIKRKDKDSPRKPTEASQLQNDEINKQEEPAAVDDVVPEEPKESLSWREKLSEDLVYVDKKEKKSLGTKLVEKFIVKNVNENDSKIDKSDNRDSDTPRIVPSETNTYIDNSLSSCEMPSTSKSPDRRCSMEFLAEQSSLLDSLIRGENLSTATLDLSKVGIADDTKNKFVSSDSIKRRKTDSKGNPLKTTKSDHSIHENLNKSLKGNKDSKVFTKRRSLKKSQSGGSICRLDSITETPKEPATPVDLPSIQENKISPKETKTEQKPKLRTKITTSVEISPPTSPLKFRIENITVEEKLCTPKKEISFSYDLDETPVQDVTLQGPKSTLRRTKERNSIKKKSKKAIGADPISPEPDDGNFWAKIGKRETVYLMKRKENLEAEREENNRSNFWFQEDQELDAYCNDSFTDNSILIENNNPNQAASSDTPLEFELNNTLTKVKNVKEGVLKTISTKLEKSKSSDNIQKDDSNTHINTSLKEKANKTMTEAQHDDLVPNSSITPEKKMHHHEAEIKDEIEKTTISNTILIEPDAETTSTSAKLANLKISESLTPETIDIVSVAKVPLRFDETPNATTVSGKELKPKSEENGAKESAKSKVDLDSSPKTNIQEKATTLKTAQNIKTLSESEVQSFEKELKPEANKNNRIASTTVDINLSSAILTQPKVVIAIPALKTGPKSEDKNENGSKPSEIIETIEVVEANNDVGLPTDFSAQFSEKKTDDVNTPSTTHEKNETIEKAIVDVNLSAKIENESANTKSKTKPASKSGEISLEKIISEKIKTIEKAKANVDVNLSAKTETKPVITESTLQYQPKSDSKIISKQSAICNDDLNFSAETKSQSVITTGKDETIKYIGDVNLSSKTGAESKEKVNSILTLQTQAKCKVEDKKSEPLVESIADVNENKQMISESTTKSMSTETTESSSKKKVKKVKVKIPEKDKDMKSNKISSATKEKVCETCKKSLGSDGSKSSKLKVTRVADSSTIKQLQGKDKAVKIIAGVDKPLNNLQKSKSDLSNSVSNSSDSNSKPETSASTSQIPIVIETKNIPNETVASDKDQVQISVSSQEKTGEENKAEKDTKGDEDSKVKQSSIKQVAKQSPKKKKEIKEKPVKALIATPRPLLKRAPQVINSDSSESSSEDSSEEESDASEMSGDFYECENNPDGRTSTGSNDSGFDSSAPTSPASFLQIKKGKFTFIHFKEQNVSLPCNKLIH